MHGKEIEARTVAEAIDHGIAYATEDRKRYGLNLIEDIKRNISAAALGKLAQRGWVNEQRGDQGRRGLPQEHEHQGADACWRSPASSPAATSRRSCCRKWIFTDPDVLILDEPTRGIDVGAKYEIYTIINQLADEGKAVVVISSELPELLGICDRIYTLSAGRITGEVPVARGDPGDASCSS